MINLKSKSAATATGTEDREKTKTLTLSSLIRCFPTQELDYEEGKRKMHIRVQASNEAKFVGGGVETAEIDFTINLVDINEPPVVLKTVFNGE